MPDDPAKTNGNSEGAKPPEFANWAEYAKAHPEASALHEADKAAVDSALEKERANVKAYAAQLRDAAKSADAETAKKLNELAAQKDQEVEQARKQLEFTKAAAKAGCNDIDLAWAAAQQAGSTDIDVIKSKHPLLFGPAKGPDARAGAGTGAKPPGKMDMDTYIRAKAGRVA